MPDILKVLLLEDVVDFLWGMACDDTVPAADRIRAAELILAYGGFKEARN